MIVAITGGTGFIGAKLVARHLAQGDTVRLLSRRPVAGPAGNGLVTVHRGDLAVDGTDLRPFVDNAEVLYHCAGEIRDLARMHAVNVEGTRRLAAVSAGRIGRWVQLSSVGVYGARRAGVVTEETPLSPESPYERTKAQSDALVAEAAGGGAFGLAILRPSIVFGPGMPSRFLSAMISMIDRGLFFFIGEPGATATYVHVDGVTEALARCGRMAEANGRTYNLSEQRTIEEFVAAIACALGKRPPTARLPEAPLRYAARVLGRIPGFPLTESRVNALVGRTVYPDTRIRSELLYAHPVSIEEGLRQMVTEWRRHA